MELFDILTFDHVQVSAVDVTVVEPDWQEVIRLTTPVRDAGLYALTFSLQFTFQSTSQSVLYRFSLDGGSTFGPTYEKEVKDRSNTEVIEVLHLLELMSSQAIDVVCEMSQTEDHSLHVIQGMITANRKA